MATVTTKVRSLITGAILEKDFVLVEVEGRDTQFFFTISPVGTADASVIKTEVEDKHQAAFEAAIVANRRVVIQQNPDWDDVKTDTTGDGVSDTARYGWVNDNDLPIYEIVV